MLFNLLSFCKNQIMIKIKEIILMKKVYFLIFLIGLCACGKNNPVESQQKGTVNGYVYQYDTHIPISKVVVSIESESYTTSSDGYYELKDIPSGERTITANIVGCSSYSKTIHVKTGDNQYNIYLSPG